MKLLDWTICTIFYIIAQATAKSGGFLDFDFSLCDVDSDCTYQLGDEAVCAHMTYDTFLGDM